MDRRRSISWTLPLLISVLLLVVVGAFSWLAYRQVERTIVTAAGERLERASSQLAEILDTSLGRIEEVAADVAASPPVRGYLLRPGELSRPAAEEVLHRLAAAGDQRTVVELWSAAEEPVLTVAGSSVDPGLLDAPPRLPPPGVGPLREEAGALYFDVVTPVTRTAGAGELGWLVQRRPLAAGQAGQLLADMVGREARLLMGNREGGLWTDLSTSVEGPPFSPEFEGGVLHYQPAEGGARLGGLARIGGTPLVSFVELPRSSVLAPARVLVRQMAGTALIVVLVGATGGWLISRRITAPLVELAHAAEAITRGDYSQRVPTARPDELGVLAASFNTMAQRVADTHHQLEDRVAERTQELHSAYRELAETQQELVRRERLAILGQLASGVGHELRNPLGVMTNAVYYINTVLGDAPEKVKEYLGILHTQIGLSEKIVSDLLDFARVRDPEVEPVDLPSLVDEQLQRVGSLGDVAVERDFPDGLRHALVDSTQIGQVVLNLLMNAVQAMENGAGTLTLRARNVDPDRVRLEVEDDGEGIPPENLEKIFEPLFTTKARGIGLGLAVSLGLVERNGGSIRASNRAGAGATFQIELPAAGGEGRA